MRAALNAAALCLAALAGAAAAADPPRAETAAEFVARANAELLDVGQEFARATWVRGFFAPHARSRERRAEGSRPTLPM
jgi:hypothetical protein